jgi:two-component system, NarL family, sensor histidine kinase UhpB
LVEMERMRNTIARDLHDDIGSTLSSINIISQLALKDANACLPDRQGSTTHFQRIAQHSSTMMESMSDIVWSINPHNDSMEQVISKMKEFASEILDPIDVAFSFSGEEHLDEVTLDVSLRKNLFLIFKEAINNAAKYSKASSVDIAFSKSGKGLQLTITDNGKGFDVANDKSGNGLRNMKERASAIKGLVEINSSLNNGTTVLVAIPLT